MAHEFEKYLSFHRENGGTGKIYKFNFIEYKEGFLKLNAEFPKETLNPNGTVQGCLLYTSPSPRDGLLSRMPSSA